MAEFILGASRIDSSLQLKSHLDVYKYVLLRNIFSGSTHQFWVPYYFSWESFLCERERQIQAQFAKATHGGVPWVVVLTG